jgi:hypothetical protein
MLANRDANEAERPARKVTGSDDELLPFSPGYFHYDVRLSIRGLSANNASLIARLINSATGTPVSTLFFRVL